MTYETRADLGGRPGYGPVVPEPEHERFHAEWEKRALALTLAMGATGEWNLDMSRSARETLADYATSSYYAIWVKGLARLLVQRGLATDEEIATGRAITPPRTVRRVLHENEVAETLAKGSSTLREPAAPARFGVGDRVRTQPQQPDHHTRLPGYARGRTGRVEHVRGVHVFPDANAQGLGEQPQWLYTVTFDGRELWGADGDASLRVSIDAWEPYLEAAP